MEQQRAGTIVGRGSLVWRKIDDGCFSLCHGRNRSRRPLLHIEPDKAWPGMWRICWPDGSKSDMVNLTRAKDAGVSLALRRLNATELTAQPAKFQWVVPPGAGRSRLGLDRVLAE